jgi:predicted Zn-dependent protease
MVRALLMVLMITLAPFMVFGETAADRIQLPSFLPEYFLPAFRVKQDQLKMVERMDKNGAERYFFELKEESAGKYIGLMVENIKCDRQQCEQGFYNLRNFLNDELKKKNGDIIELTRSEIRADIHPGGGVEVIHLGFKMPTSIQVWTYHTVTRTVKDIEDQLGFLKALINRQRYDEARLAGNIAMGVWGPQIYDHARQLLKDGKKKEGLSVLADLLTTSPNNFEAHVTFMENTDDAAAATRSARIVFENAENASLVDRAAKYLGIRVEGYDSIPRLEKGEKGLQVILIPLQPCNVRLLKEAAAVYEKITGVPTKMRRLDVDWQFKDPDRIFRQPVIQEQMVARKGKIDFTGWTKTRYIEELRKIAGSESPLERYYIKDLIKTIEDEPGQFRVDPYLGRFAAELEKYRSGDRRTMYVGVTEVDIYSGDSNYIFSSGLVSPNSQGTILSYYMMLTAPGWDRYEPRKRLTERLAKELVPASLKALNIPRSTDPRCPYSYSASLDRLDEKTLSLSDEVKAALDKLKK